MWRDKVEKTWLLSWHCAIRCFGIQDCNINTGTREVEMRTRMKWNNLDEARREGMIVVVFRRTVNLIPVRDM